MNNPFSTRSEMGIKKRVFLVLLIILIPLLLLEAFVFFKWFHARKEAALQANLELARAVAINFETFFKGLLRDELALGLALTSTQPLPDKDRDYLLDEIESDNPAIRSISWINPNGRVIASSLRSSIGIDLNDRSYFQKTKHRYEWVISELVMGKITNEPTFVVSRGIRDYAGQLMGVVAASIEPGRLESIIGIDRSQDAGLSLLDNKGMHVASYPATEYTWDQRNWLKHYPIIAETLKGRELTAAVSSSLTGQARLSAFTPVPLIGWVAAASRAESEVTKDILQVLMPNLVLTLFVTLAAFGAAIGLFHPLTGSILKLKSHATAIGQGKTAHIDPEGPYELRVLAGTLNQMAEKIRARGAAIRQSESLYRAIAENFPEGAILVFDHDLRVRTADGTALSSLGFSMESLVEKTILEATDEEVYRMLKEFCPRVLTGGSFHCELIVKERIFSSYFVPIQDDSGKVLLGMVVCYDVTDRKRAEEALKSALAKAEAGDQMLAALMESVPEGITICDAAGEIRMVSRHGREMVGSQLVGKRIEDLVGEGTIYRHDGQTAVSMTELPLFRALNGELVHNIELQVDVSGSKLYLLCNAAPILNGDGAVVGGIVSWRDITERKRVEQERESLIIQLASEKEAITQSEERYRIMGEILPYGIWLCDAEGKTVYTSQSFLDLLDMSMEESKGFAWTQRLLAEDVQPMMKKWMNCIQTGEDWDYEHRIIDQTGALRTVLSRGRPIRDKHGTITAWAGINLDITGRKKLEDALRDWSATLEQQVAERTQLAESRAKQLQALAVDLIEAEEKERQRFAHLLHDDLQQLLAAAKMQLQSVSVKLLSDATLKYVEELLEESISKSRRLSHELSPSVLQSSNMVDAFTWLAQRMKEQFGFFIGLDASGEQQIGSAPVRRFLFGAVRELLFNVVKHAGVKEATIALKASNGRFEVTVSDQGKGFEIDEAQVGLGLLSIRERASYIGGELKIQSTPGRGSSFTLIVPLEVSKAEGTHKPVAAEDLKTKPIMADGIRVLVVDDHKVIRQGLTKILAGQPNIQVVGEAANGCEAMEMTGHLRPHIVIMDISMPEMDGIEATRNIKAEAPEVHVIGLSMHDEQFMLHAMHQAGAEVTLNKSVSSSELLRNIYRLASRPRNGG